MWLPSFLKEAYAMSVARAGFFSGLIILSAVVASPLGGFLSDRFFGGKRRSLIIVEMILLATFSVLSSLPLRFSFLLVPLIFMGLLIWLPDVLFTALPADLFSRKMAGTATGFMVSFGCLAAIIGMYVSGLLVDLFRSYAPLFLSFAFLAFLGTIGVCFVRERH
jgi:sugar phosphate permease